MRTTQFYGITEIFEILHYSQRLERLNKNKKLVKFPFHLKIAGCLHKNKRVELSINIKQMQIGF